jgi:NitT/TauT family transport system ATP-binding protein
VASNGLDIRGVAMRYGEGPGAVSALESIDLSIARQEFVTIVGPSGCGKSTLLYLVGGFLAPSAGQILLNGAPITGPGPDRGIVFQRYSLFPWRTVAGNIGYGLEEQGVPKAERERIVAEHIRLVHLEGFADRYPRELSGGMQQRVSICRALVHDPSVLLMDEPFAALDAMTREELGFELMRIWSTDKKTVIFVTHNITEAILLADRVVAMSPRPGRIAKIVDIDLPRPRTIDMEFTPQFKSYSDQIRAVIYHGGGASKR